MLVNQIENEKMVVWYNAEALQNEFIESVTSLPELDRRVKKIVEKYHSIPDYQEPNIRSDFFLVYLFAKNEFSKEFSEIYSFKRVHKDLEVMTESERMNLVNGLWQYYWESFQDNDLPTTFEDLLTF